MLKNVMKWKQIDLTIQIAACLASVIISISFPNIRELLSALICWCLCVGMVQFLSAVAHRAWAPKATHKKARTH